MAQQPWGPASTPLAAVPLEAAAASLLSEWTVDDGLTVAVDGSQVWDPDESREVPAVVMRMPSHMARHLAAVLDDWTTVAQLLESARGADERELAGILHEAARAADARAGEGADCSGHH